jgi:hypothetical protein
MIRDPESFNILLDKWQINGESFGPGTSVAEVCARLLECVGEGVCL